MGTHHEIELECCETWIACNDGEDNSTEEFLDSILTEYDERQKQQSHRRPQVDGLRRNSISESNTSSKNTSRRLSRKQLTKTFARSKSGQFTRRKIEQPTAATVHQKSTDGDCDNVHHRPLQQSPISIDVLEIDTSSCSDHVDDDSHPNEDSDDYKDDENHHYEQEQNPISPLTTNESRKKRTSPTQQEQFNDEDCVQAPEHLAFHWEDLQLGSVLGSAAYNEFLKQQHLRQRLTRSSLDCPFPQLTPLQIYQAVQSMKLKTILPPATSRIHSITHNSRAEKRRFLRRHVGDEDHEYSHKPLDSSRSLVDSPFQASVRLYETMCAQDVDDGMTYRRRAQNMSSHSCLEILARLESEVSDLQQRQDRVFQTARQAGLMTSELNQQISQFLGYSRPAENEEGC